MPNLNVGQPVSVAQFLGKPKEELAKLTPQDLRSKVKEHIRANQEGDDKFILVDKVGSPEGLDVEDKIVTVKPTKSSYGNVSIRVLSTELDPVYDEQIEHLLDADMILPEQDKQGTELLNTKIHRVQFKEPSTDWLGGKEFYIETNAGLFNIDAGGALGLDNPSISLHGKELSRADITRVIEELKAMKGDSLEARGFIKILEAFVQYEDKLQQALETDVTGSGNHPSDTAVGTYTTVKKGELLKELENAIQWVM